MHGFILNIMFRLTITYIVVSCISKIVRQFSEMVFKLLSDIMRKMPVSHIKSVLGKPSPKRMTYQQVIKPGVKLSCLHAPASPAINIK